MTARGLTMSREERAADLAALVRELDSYESRLAGIADDHPDRSKWETRAELVREQLALRGQEGAAPVKRATRRTRSAADAEER